LKENGYKAAGKTIQSEQEFACPNGYFSYARILFFHEHLLALGLVFMIMLWLFDCPRTVVNDVEAAISLDLEAIPFLIV
jgi:hypothetical protein